MKYCVINENQKSKRVTICVNGYLSDESGNGNWNAVVRARPDDKILVYHFPTIATMADDEKLKFSDFLNFKTKKILKRLNNETYKFTKGVELAKKSGELLAYLLLLDFPEKYKKVDLIGFSLGTQVIKSCLQTLNTLGVKSLIKNVYFMGGATWLNVNEADIFDTVSKSINHCYTKRDHTLSLYQYHQKYFNKEVIKIDKIEEEEEEEKEKELFFTLEDEEEEEDETITVKKQPIGRSKLKKELCQILEAKGLEINQHNVGEYVGEHFLYWKYLDEILILMKV